MVNWTAAAEVARDADAFSKIVFILFGLYTWEVLTTFDFDWQIITRKRPMRWPLIFYFLTRYCLLFALIGLIIVLSVKTEVNCQALYTFDQWAGNTAIASASTCLMFRTIAVWEKKMFIVIPLVLLSLGQWALLYHAVVIVKSSWVPQATTCVVTGTSATELNVIFFYTMGFDFVVLVTTVIGLLISSARSGLWQLLFRDGVSYFIMTFLANMVPAVLNLLNLNPAMNIIATVPAACVSTIAASRAVVRLIMFRDADVYVHGSSYGGASTRIGSRKTALASAKNRSTLAKYTGTPTQISMDTFTPAPGIEDDRHTDHSEFKSHLDLESGPQWGKAQ